MIGAARIRQREGGYTLLEIVGALVVLSIIVVLVLPSFTSGPARARDKTRKADLLTIKQALETYYSSNNTYPGTLTWKSDLTTGPTPELSKLPTDPKTHANYVYAPIPTGCTTGSCTSYTLSAKLENSSDKQATHGVYSLSSAY